MFWPFQERSSYWFKFVDEKALKSDNFDDFYRYAFRYCLTGKQFRISYADHIMQACEVLILMHLWLFSEDNKKCLDIETACVLLQLVLGARYQAQVDSFIQFLKVSIWKIHSWWNLTVFALWWIFKFALIW